MARLMPALIMANLQEGELACDQTLQSAPVYFDRSDPRWQGEESALKPEARDEG